MLRTQVITAMTFGPALGKGRFVVRLARSDYEIARVQKLRQRIFFEEQTPQYDTRDRNDRDQDTRDQDILDSYCDHLIILDQQAKGRLVGGARLIQRSAAEQAGCFYSAGEYDLTPVLSYPGTILELGRFCIDPAYRDGAVARLLWKGLSRYIANFDIDLMFGCASLPETQGYRLSESLSYLQYYHRAPASLRPCALPSLRLDMPLIPYEKIDKKRAFSQLPPLIKAYLRIGGGVGEGAVIDHHFGTTDVLVVVQTTALATRHRQMGLAQRQQAPQAPTVPP